MSWQGVDVPRVVTHPPTLPPEGTVSWKLLAVKGMCARVVVLVLGTPDLCLEFPTFISVLGIGERKTGKAERV